MPMSTQGYFLYAVMVVTLWASPLILLALWFGWKRKQLVKTVVGVLIAVPVIAGACLLLFFGSAGLGAEMHAAKHERFQESVNEVFGPLPPAVAVRGYDAGIVQRGGDDYRRLVFGGVWPDDPNRQLEVWWPQGKGQPFVSAVREPQAPDAERRLWLVMLRPPFTQFSPYGDGKALVREHLPALQLGTDPPDVVLHLVPNRWIFRRSDVPVEGNMVWPVHTADIDFDAIAGAH